MEPFHTIWYPAKSGWQLNVNKHRIERKEIATILLWLIANDNNVFFTRVASKPAPVSLSWYLSTFTKQNIPLITEISY